MSTATVIIKKRANRTQITEQATERGYMTHNEQVMLKSLDVKNALQRINTRAFDGELKVKQCAEVKRLMTAFVKSINEIIN